MLCHRPLTCRLVVFDEHPLEVIRRVDDIRLEACEPIHSSGLEHNWQVIGHHVGVATAGSDGDGTTRQPLLEIGMVVIWLDLVDLKVCRQQYGAEPSRESTRPISDNGGVINGLWGYGSYGTWGAGSRSGG